MLRYSRASSAFAARRGGALAILALLLLALALPTFASPAPAHAATLARSAAENETAARALPADLEPFAPALVSQRPDLLGCLLADIATAMNLVDLRHGYGAGHTYREVWARYDKIVPGFAGNVYRYPYPWTAGGIAETFGYRSHAQERFSDADVDGWLASGASVVVYLNQGPTSPATRSSFCSRISPGCAFKTPGSAIRNGSARAFTAVWRPGSRWSAPTTTERRKPRRVPRAGATPTISSPELHAAGGASPR